MFNLLRCIRTQISTLDEFLELLALNEFKIFVVVSAHTILMQAE